MAATIRTRSAAAKKAVRTKGPVGLRRAGRKAVAGLPTGTLTKAAMGRQARRAAAERGPADLSRAARRAVRTKGPRRRHEAAVKAARSRAR